MLTDQKLMDPKMIEYDHSIHMNPDAKAWAEFFMKTKEENKWSLADIDESLMIGWFANAMMAMHDHLHHEKIDQLQRKNDEKDARISKLIELITDAYRSYTDHEGDDVGAFRNIVSAVSHIVDYELKDISTQSLQHIEAAAVDGAIKHCKLKVLVGPDIYSDCLQEYAKQLRQKSNGSNGDEW